MAKKFYFSSLARRPLTLGGHRITFLVSNISGGSAAGVYATENADEISVLDDAVRGRRGVSEITEDQFIEGQKKKLQTPSSSNTNVSPPRLVRPQITPPLSVDEKAGVVSAANPKPSEQSAFQGDRDARSNPSIASLMMGRVKKLNPPKPFATSEAKTEKASKRADRAKVRIARTNVSAS